MSKDIKEAVHRFQDFYECPHGCSAYYSTYSFTHRRFICKDCNNEFLVPEHIKLNKEPQFTKRKKPNKGA